MSCVRDYCGRVYKKECLEKYQPEVKDGDNECYFCAENTVVEVEYATEFKDLWNFLKRIGIVLKILLLFKIYFDLKKVFSNN